MTDTPSSLVAALGERYRDSLLQRCANAMLSQLRAVGFWAAVTLPFLYGPLLVRGLDSTADAVAFAVLFATNLGALLLGRNHAA